MISVAKIEKIEATSEILQPVATSPKEEPSALELFSYGFCCVVQGLVGLVYLALITLVPVAIQQGIWFR